MKITKQLIGFGIAITILTIAFRFFLSLTIEQGSVLGTVTAAVLYFFAMAFTGWIFGKKECRTLPLYDIGFRFHFVTYLVYNGVSELWYLLGFNAPHEQIDSIHCTALIWGIFLIAHFILYLFFRKKSMDGLDTKELFE